MRTPQPTSKIQHPTSGLGATNQHPRSNIQHPAPLDGPPDSGIGYVSPAVPIFRGEDIMPAKLKTQIQYFVLCFAITTAALAQDRGTIRGTVADPSGAAVPDALVTVKNVNTGLAQTAKTGVDGVYNVPYLPVGDYAVTTEKIGFRKAEAAGVRVDVNSVVDLDIRLTVGSIDQSIEVAAAAPLLETQGTNLGKVVPTKAINDLPLF